MKGVCGLRSVPEVHAATLFFFFPSLSLSLSHTETIGSAGFVDVQSKGLKNCQRRGIISPGSAGCVSSPVQPRSTSHRKACPSACPPARLPGATDGPNSRRTQRSQIRFKSRGGQQRGGRPWVALPLCCWVQTGKGSGFLVLPRPWSLWSDGSLSTSFVLTTSLFFKDNGNRDWQGRYWELRGTNL